MSNQNNVHKGSCLCGVVTFTVNAELTAPVACHCTKCRKHSGHYEASTEVPKSSVKVNGVDKITWHQSSDKARRGFCSICGSSLFWEPIYKDWTAVAMGAFDGPTNTKLARHIYVANKGDYYDLTDGVPQDMYPPGQ